MRIGVRVRNRTEDVEHVEQALEQLGWRLLLPSDASSRGGQVDAVVEARFPGSRFGALSRATRDLGGLISSHGLALELSGPAYLSRARQMSHNVYTVSYAPSPGPDLWSRLERLLSRLGAWKIIRWSAPADTTQDDWPAYEAQFRADQGLDPLRPLRVTPALPDPAAPRPTQVAPRRAQFALIVGLAPLLAALLLCGAWLRHTDGLWTAAPLLSYVVLAAATIALALWCDPRSVRHEPFAAALVLTLAFFALGFAVLGPKTPSGVFLWFPAALLIAAVVWGVVLLARTVRPRESVIAISLAVIPLLIASVLPWAEDVGHGAFLDEFGLAPGDVTVPSLMRMALILKAFVYSSVTLVIFASFSGWSRYFHIHWPRWISTVFVTLIVVAYVAAGFTTIEHETRAAVAHTKSAAVEGRPLPGFYGINPELVCIRQLADPIRYTGMRPPLDRPVVDFGHRGDYVNLWDPATERTFSVRLEDVALESAQGRPARCAAAG